MNKFQKIYYHELGTFSDKDKIVLKTKSSL